MMRDLIVMKAQVLLLALVVATFSQSPASFIVYSSTAAVAVDDGDGDEGNRKSRRGNTKRGLQSLDDICGLSGGTVNGDGDCVVCLDATDDKCCTLDPTDFGTRCEEFCTTTVYDSLPQRYCGETTCMVQGAGSVCSGSIPFSTGSNNTLAFTFTCGAGGLCTCDEVSFGGIACSGGCTGALDSYDCSNVPDGPIREEIENGDDQQTAAPLDRPYVTDEAFQTEVSGLTLVSASTAAGVPIGAAIGSSNFADTIRKYVGSEYNMVVAENAMKWNNMLVNVSVLAEYNFTLPDSLVDAALKAGATVVRGHTLIWGRIPGSTYPTAVMDAVVAQADEPSKKAALQTMMEDHINEVAGHFRDSVNVWDVVNEHLSSQTDANIFFAVFGHDYVKMAFEMARVLVPDDVRLVWNEAIGNFNLSDPTIRLWLQLLRQYKDEGVPISGIGIQGHHIFDTHNLQDVRAFMKEVAKLGYDIELTELDARVVLFQPPNASTGVTAADPFKAQGDFFADYVGACLDSGVCKGVTFWGVDDANTWMDEIFHNTKPNLPLLIDEEGNKKPAWLSVRQALETFNQEGSAAGTRGKSARPSTIMFLILLGVLLA